MDAWGGLHAHRGSVGRALSILGLFRDRQKARKLGLLELSTFESIIKNGFGKSKEYVKIQERTVVLPRGRKPGFMHVVAEMPEKGGVKTVPDTIRRQVK